MICNLCRRGSQTETVGGVQAQVMARHQPGVTKGRKHARGWRRPGFEGGQMPYREDPKRGFTNIFKNYSIVNVKDLKGLTTHGCYALLIESGLIKSIQDGVKVLGDGELTKRLVVKAHKVSQAAESKIAARGGRIEVI